MKVVILFGAYAAGKTAVAKKLCESTGMSLYQNCVNFDALSQLFQYSTEIRNNLSDRLRKTVLQTYLITAETGLVIPYLWCFDWKSGFDDVHAIESACRQAGAKVCYAELVADEETRRQRNREKMASENGGAAPDPALCDGDFFRNNEEFRFVSLPGELMGKHHFRLDNTLLSPEEAAQRIRAAFDL